MRTLSDRIGQIRFDSQPIRLNDRIRANRWESPIGKPLVESLAGAVESGTRDQHLDSLVNELTNRFNSCQQLLNSISGSINAKAVTVEGQKRKLEESEQLLNQRRELINRYRNSVEELVNPDSGR
ncbi:hypothetical protein Taro_032178 [Colocasia esculenta]|uniref:Mediator of RNA polymerase II transcription subunit 9 n=1 Tax=Colocasia esculenta TaxID=4460 RepID=A0A843VU42_COLES|nr:hypothetical protein [Colocasia esculenta]